jgi:transposase InsO family protein
MDIFSQFAYAIPLKSKSSTEIIEAFTKLFISRKPKKLWSDQRSELTYNLFTKFLKYNNIELYHVYNEEKACVVQRFNRTLGQMISKHVTTNKTKNYTNVLQKLIDEYNNRYHSSIKMTPFETSKLENRDKYMINI